ncbi:MAG: Maf family protein [Planctomycetales bacterium]
MTTRVILASRSPQRLALLQLLVSHSVIEVRPPRSPDEAGFAGLHDLSSIRQRLMEIARGKAADVWEQMSEDALSPIIIAADTVIVVEEAAGRSLVLGQPPSDETWPDIVRGWFRDYYAGRTHRALTALVLRSGDQAPIERVVETEVMMRPDVEPLLEWYLSTGEPRGKAGGYAIQGAGSVFVIRLSGSLSNVVGLPLEALREALEECSGT